MTFNFMNQKYKLYNLTINAINFHAINSLPTSGLIVVPRQQEGSLMIGKVHLFLQIYCYRWGFFILLAITSVDVTCCSFVRAPHYIQDKNSYRSENSPIVEGQLPVLVRGCYKWHCSKFHKTKLSHKWRIRPCVNIVGKHSQPPIWASYHNKGTCTLARAQEEEAGGASKNEATSCLTHSL